MLSMSDPRSRKSFLTEQERQEAEAINVDTLDKLTDIDKLNKFEKYFRDGGYTQLAQRCLLRLKALCALPDDLDPRNMQDREYVREEISMFSKQMANKPTTVTLPTNNLSVPVRSSAGRKVPSSSRSSESVADVAPDERKQLAEMERIKGNDCYKAKEHREAIRYYTASINWYPTAAAHGNRAAVHLALKEWDAAIEDCTEALNLSPDPELELKLRLRRITCYTRTNRHNLAFEDIHAGLVLKPDSKELHSYRQEAEKALGKVVTKRIAIEEVSDDDDDNYDQDDSHDDKDQNDSMVEPSGTFQKVAAETLANLKFRPIPVVEFTDSDADDNEQEASRVGGRTVDTSAEASELDIFPTAQHAQHSEKQQHIHVDANSVPVTPSQSAAFGHKDKEFIPTATVDGGTRSLQIPEAIEESLDGSGLSSEDVSDDDSVCALPSEVSDAELGLELDPPVDEAFVKNYLNQKAEKHKTEGNTQHGAQQHKAALFSYLQALEFKPSSAVLYNNCAIVRVSIGSYDQAIKDSTIAIALKPDYAKAYWKRADAKQAINLLEDALEDLQECKRYTEDPITLHSIALQQNQIRTRLKERQLEAEKNRAKNTSHYASAHVSIIEEDEVDAAISRLRRKVMKLQHDAVLEANRLPLKASEIEQQHLQQLQTKQEAQRVERRSSALARMAEEHAAAHAKKRQRREAKLARRKAADAKQAAASVSQQQQQPLPNPEVGTSCSISLDTTSSPSSSTPQAEGCAVQSHIAQEQSLRKERFEREKAAANGTVRAGKPEDGVKLYNDLLMKYPEHSTVLNLNKAHALLQMERHEEAERLCTQLLSQQDMELPYKAKVLHRRATALQQLQKWQLAVADAEAALKLVPALRQMQHEPFATQLQDFCDQLVANMHTPQGSSQQCSDTSKSARMQVAAETPVEPSACKPKDAAAAAETPVEPTACHPRDAAVAPGAVLAEAQLKQQTASATSSSRPSTSQAPCTGGKTETLQGSSSSSSKSSSKATPAGMQKPLNDNLPTLPSSSVGHDELAVLLENIQQLTSIQNLNTSQGAASLQRKMNEMRDAIARVQAGTSSTATSNKTPPPNYTLGLVRSVADKESAEEFRATGNAAVKNKDYKKAQVAYSCSLAKDPGNAKTWGNQALVHIKLNEFDKAIEDARKSLELDPEPMKIKFRLAFALNETKRHAEAYVVAQQMIEAHGETACNRDSLTRELLSKLEMWKTESVAKQAAAGSSTRSHPAEVDPLEPPVAGTNSSGPSDASYSAAISGAAETAAAVPPAPLRTPATSATAAPTPVSMAFPSAGITSHSTNAGSAVTATATPQQSQQAVDTRSAGIHANIATTSAVPAAVPAGNLGEEDVVKTVLQKEPLYRPCIITKKIVIEEVESSSDDESTSNDLFVASNGSQQQQRLAAPSQIFSSSRTSSSCPSTTSEMKSAPVPAPTGRPNLQAALSKAAVAVSIQQQQATLEAPKSVTAFDQTCTRLLASGSIEQLVQYVKTLPPSQYQSFFKETLSPKAVEGILTAMDACGEADGAFALKSLEALAQVNRFDFVVRLAKEVKPAIRSLYSKLEGSGLEVPGPLKKKYKV